MTWRIISPTPGLQKLTDGSSTQNHPVGKIIMATDDATSGQGTAEFIYLLSPATIIGSLVTYNATTGQATLTAAATDKFTGVPVAVAMRANTAGQYGWFQISGLAVIKKTAVAVTPKVNLFMSATAGRVKVLRSGGMLLEGAKSANLATISAGVSTITALLNRPHIMGEVTLV